MSVPKSFIHTKISLMMNDERYDVYLIDVNKMDLIYLRENIYNFKSQTKIHLIL